MRGHHRVAIAIFEWCCAGYQESETGAKILTASLMVANQQHMDYGRVAAEYGKASNGLGYDAPNAFEKINPSGMYATAKNELANLMINNSIKYTKDGKEFNANPVSLLTMGEITPEQLSFFNSDLKKVWEPGEFIIQIGTNSSEVQAAKVNWNK